MSTLLNLMVGTEDAQSFSHDDQASSIDIAKTGKIVERFALQAVIDDTTPSNKTFDNGTSEVTTLTFPSKAGSTGGDYFVVFDTAGLGWAAALNKSGSDPVPSGAVWTAIASGRKVNVDISSATTAAQVAALVETAFDALSSNPFVTDDSAADGTMLVTCTLHGNTTNAQRHNANDSGNGSMGVSTTTPGTASEVDVTANSVAIPTHGFSEGLKVTLTTTGTLPAGLATATPYYLIIVDAGNVKFASSLQNALDGTPVDITSEGSSAGVNTLVVAALAGSFVMRGSLTGAVWFDISPSQTISSETEYLFSLTQPTVKFVALGVAISAGQLTIDQTYLGKGLA